MPMQTGNSTLNHSASYFAAAVYTFPGVCLGSYCCLASLPGLGRILRVASLIACLGVAVLGPEIKGQSPATSNRAVQAIDAAAARSIVTIDLQQCVWRAGDNPAWAAPNLDETGWQPYSNWIPDPSQPRLWVRCRADFSSLQNLPHPALQVGMYAAYELYQDGRKLGGNGNLDSGNFSLNSIRSYALQPRAASSGFSLFALRITRSNLITSSTVTANLLSPKMELRAGDETLLDGLRAQAVLARSSRYSGPSLCYGVIGVMAIMLLGLFIYDHSRREFLLLSSVCLSLALLRLNEFCMASLLDYPLTIGLGLVSIGNIVLTLTQAPFYFALLGRRMPLPFRLLIVVTLLTSVPGIVAIVMGLQQPAWLSHLNMGIVRAAGLLLHVALATAPFFALWPFSAIEQRIRPLAALCVVSAIGDLTWYAFQITANPLFRIPDLFTHSASTVLEVRAFFTAGVLAALLGLLFRDQRRITEERAMLSGEMQAAREIQRILIPALPASAPGISIDAAFLPAREVGGDFYRCRVLPDGSQWILIGDVSGKGTAAGITGAMLLGAAGGHESDPPAKQLSRLNQELCNSGIGGFVTCLVLHISADGIVTAANAGHLAPYRNGEEVELDSGFPLGITSEAAYVETRFELGDGDRLTLLSDGVVEARNPSGELFGFSRTQSVSGLSAEKIASAAQGFGQNDDITVLALSYVRLTAASLREGHRLAKTL